MNRELRIIEVVSKTIANSLFIENYLKEVPKMMDSHIIKIDAEARKKILEKTKNDSDLSKVLKNIYNGLVQWKPNADRETMPKYFNSSCFLLVFALLEDSSKELGRISKEIFSSKLSVSDIYEKNEIKKVKVYLEKHLCIDLSDQNENWRKIDLFITVRNSIIHKNSFVDNSESKSNKKLVEHLVKEPRLNFEHNQFAIIDPSYVKEFLGVTEEYIVGIAESILEKLDEEDNKMTQA